MENPEIHTDDVALFSRPPMNVGEDKVSWIPIRPSFISSGDNSSIQFHIPGNSSQYLKLSQSMLYVKLKIVKDDGSSFDTTSTAAVEHETATPIDLILHSLWSSVDIKLNHTLVSTSGTDYMYKAMIETLLNYSSETKANQLPIIGFSGDSGNFEQTSPLIPPMNHGLRTRYLWFDKESMTAEIYGPSYV